MKEEFLKWINAWKYGKGDSDLKWQRFYLLIYLTQKKEIII